MVLDSSAAHMAVEDFIDRAAGHITHKFPPRAFITTLSPDHIAALASFPGVTTVRTEAVDPLTMAGYGPDVARWVAVWNSLVTPEPAITGTPLTQKHTLENEPDHAFVAPDFSPNDKLSLASDPSITPGFYQTSEYLAGSVAVGLILLESDGTAEPSTEDWTEDEKQLVFNEIVAGLNWWAEVEPRANLTFVYDDHFNSPVPHQHRADIPPISGSKVLDSREYERLGLLGRLIFYPDPGLYQ